MEGGEIGEDWEVLLHSSDEEVETSHGSFSSMIKSDYFSLENQERFGYAKTELGSVESDNPSWVDPVSVSADKESVGFLSDSGSDDRSDDQKGHDFEVKVEFSELGIVAGNDQIDVLSERVDENLGKDEAGIEANPEVGSFGYEASDKLWSDSSGDERRSSVESVKLDEEDESIGSNKELEEEDESTDESRSVAVEEVKTVANFGGENEKRMVLWWKVPLEVLKYCVFKVSPVWSVSVAAAVMGLVILGRRLHRMKRKRQSLQLKLALDDKNKVSQFMSRAERLNEAFSVVRRVPILRPLPPSGVNPWPVMSLR